MQSAEMVSVSLPSDLLREIRDAVRRGEFASTSEALRDALRVWQSQRSEDAERLTAIRARIRRSLDDPRPDLDAESVERRLANLHAETVDTHRGAKA